jgi:hypothetical protein
MIEGDTALQGEGLQAQSLIAPSVAGHQCGCLPGANREGKWLRVGRNEGTQAKNMRWNCLICTIEYVRCSRLIFHLPGEDDLNLGRSQRPHGQRPRSQTLGIPLALGVRARKLMGINGT